MSRLASGRTGLVVAGLTFLALLGAVWWFWVAPARDSVAERERELDEITLEANAILDTVERLRAESPGAAARTVERLRLAKALPADPQVPGALVQLHDLAERSGVEVTSISAAGTASYGALQGADFELSVGGRFHDVDDFLYRLHNQVQVDESRRPIVQGRLFALRSVSLAPADAGTGTESSGTRLLPGTRVIATVTLVAYMAPPDGAPDAGPALTPAQEAPAAPDATDDASPAPSDAPGIAEGAAAPAGTG